MAIDIEKIARLVLEEMIRLGLLRNSGGAASSTSASVPLGSQPGAAAPPNAPPKGRVLALILATRHGLEEAAMALNGLQKQGYAVSVHFSSNCKYVFDVAAYTQRLKPETVLTELPIDKLRDILCDKKLVLVPSLTRNTTARLGMGITQSGAEHALLTALGLKVPVLAGTDGINPELAGSCPVCAVALPGMGELLTEYQQRLTRFGFQLLGCSALAGELFRLLESKPSQEKAGGPVLSGMITYDDVRLLTGPEVRLAAKARLTPLAEEFLNDRRLIVKRIEQ